MDMYDRTDLLGTFIRDRRFNAELYEHNIDLDALSSGVPYVDCLKKPCLFASWGGEHLELSLVESWTILRDSPPLWSCALRVVCGAYMSQQLNDILTGNVAALCPLRSARLYLRCNSLSPQEDAILIAAAGQVPDFDIHSIQRDKDA